MSAIPELKSKTREIVSLGTKICNARDTIEIQSKDLLKLETKFSNLISEFQDDSKDRTMNISDFWPLFSEPVTPDEYDKLRPFAKLIGIKPTSREGILHISYIRKRWRDFNIQGRSKIPARVWIQHLYTTFTEMVGHSRESIRRRMWGNKVGYVMSVVPCNWCKLSTPLTCECAYKKFYPTDEEIAKFLDNELGSVGMYYEAW